MHVLGQLKGLRALSGCSCPRPESVPAASPSEDRPDIPGPPPPLSPAISAVSSTSCSRLVHPPSTSDTPLTAIHSDRITAAFLFKFCSHIISFPDAVVPQGSSRCALYFHCKINWQLCPLKNHNSGNRHAHSHDLAHLQRLLFHAKKPEKLDQIRHDQL